MVLWHCSIIVTHYPAHGGGSNANDRCGAICIIYSAGYTNNSWLYGTALSFKPYVHIILLMVVFLLMVPNVEHFILVSTVVLVLLPGSLALLYHCTHYTFRGGTSRSDDNCGAFFVYDDGTAGYTRWYIGAALSFKLDINYRVIVSAITLYILLDNCNILNFFFIRDIIFFI